MDIINSHRLDVTQTRHIHGFITLLLLTLLTVPLVQAEPVCANFVANALGSSADGTEAWACGRDKRRAARCHVATGFGSVILETPVTQTPFLPNKLPPPPRWAPV